MIRLLLIGSGAIGSLERSYFLAFQALEGVSVELFSTEEHLSLRQGPSLVARIMARVTYATACRGYGLKLEAFLRAANYDCILVIKGAELTLDTLRVCQSLTPGGVWANLNPDDPLNVTSKGSTNQNIVDCLPLFAYHFTWSERVLNSLLRRGCRNVHYLPFGYDTSALSTMTPTPTPSSTTVVFVGAWDPEREHLLGQLTDYDLHIYGVSWTRASHKSLRRRIHLENLHGAALLNAYAAAAISLNLLRPQNQGSHNMRTFEIPVAGGVMLTLRTEEQQKFFPEGEACLMYATIEELRAMILLALSSDNSDAMLRMRASARSAALPHTYESRAKCIIAAIRCSEDTR